MSWGIFEKEDRSALHIAPSVIADGEGFVRTDHELTPECQCQPRLDATGRIPVWTHHDEDADEPETEEVAN